MNKEIASQPDATKFRSIATIILVLICIAVFLKYTEHLSAKAGVIARDRVLSDIKYSLAMMLYDYTIKGKTEELQSFDDGNPFVVLAIYRGLPGNYRGAKAEFPENPEPGWYFDLSLKQVVYINNKSEFEKFYIKFLYEDVDQNGRFDRQLDVLKGLVIKKAS
ncbi:MAG: hypothetical protein GY744_17465 [Gammaproteobacteria bacterium]|nr:hypothetical protein [Gammaproteobacteria bacterium]